jgi:hypothetical protein
MTPGATTNLWTAVLSDLTRQAAQQLELQLGGTVALCLPLVRRRGTALPRRLRW